MQTVEKLFENLDVTNLSPYQVYNLYLRNLGLSGLGWPKVYMTSALTSGGYRRNTQIEFGDAFLKNAYLARDIIKALENAGLLPKNDLIIFPGDTKSPEDSWGQLEYSLFFIFMILGVERKGDTELIEQYVKENVDMSGFLNRKGLRQERIKSYENIVDLVEKYIRDNNINVSPVERIIELLDSDQSLGSWMEAEIAKRFGAKVFRVQINTSKSTDDEVLQKVIDQIVSIYSVDPTFDFFGNNTGESIYLKEM